MIDQLIATVSVKKQGLGWLRFLINHAAAITKLDRLGYKKVARQA